MKKWIISAIACSFFLGFVVIPGLHALTTQHEYLDNDMSYEFGDYPDNMLLYAPEEYGEMREAPSPFSHSVHGEYDCGECHHDENNEPWDGSWEIQGCMSEGCHDIAVAKSPKDRRDIRYFYKAYHDHCMTGCHRDLAKAGEPTGPTACVDCHPK
ncbi:MAG: cytochrome c3 family protein [Desulfonatronovibrionaceae bacterium]